MQYGYIESKVKIEKSAGIWPAFWLWHHDENSTPMAQEIDIFEMVPGRKETCGVTVDDEYYHNRHIMTTNAHVDEPSSDPLCTTHFQPARIYDYEQWHVYGLEWSPSKIIWYLDDAIIRILDNPGIHEKTTIILNFALNPETGFVTNELYQLTDFPLEMHVDYVKVYKLDPKFCAIDLNLCNYDFSNHDNEVRKNINVGNGACQNNLSIGDDVFLRAGEGILFNKNFYVPIGAKLYADVNRCEK